jgi:hypothetical protein
MTEGRPPVFVLMQSSAKANYPPPLSCKHIVIDLLHSLAVRSNGGRFDMKGLVGPK